MHRLIKVFNKFSRRQYILVGGVLVCVISLGMYLNYANALTATLVPTSTENNAWTGGTTGCITATTGHTCVDEGPTGNDTDFVATGTSLGSGVMTTFQMGDQPNVGNATNITVYYYARSVALNGNAPNADTITMDLSLAGSPTGSTLPQSMSTSFSWYSAQFTGNWTQAEVNDMRVMFTRNVVGGGNQNNADDNVQISSVYVSMTYTSPVVISQAAYRWFDSDKTRGSGSFAPDVEYAVGTNPRGVVSGYFNGDQYVDMVTANVQTDNVSMLLGNGDGTFAAKVDYAVGDGPVSIVSGDFNKDQKLDIITTNINGYTLSVLLGNGDGTFAAKVDYPAQTVVAEIAVGDLDGDQNLDIVTTGQVMSQYAVHMGNGDGTFDARVNTSASDFRGITLADVNNDQKLDLVAANYATDAVSVALGNGDGTFGAKVDYPTADATYMVATGDFNNDQKIDIVSGSQTHTAVSVLLGNGDGTFGAKVDYPAGTGSAGLHTIDLNGDGNRDIVSVIENNADTAVAVLKGNGDGTFGTKVNYIAGAVPWAAASGDANNDGAVDLFVTNNGGSTVSVLLNILDYPALAAVNTAAKVPADGDSFRLRLNLGVSDADLSTGSQFKLRYQQKSGACSTNPANYADVTTSTPIRYFDDPAIADKSAYVASDLDPVRAGVTATRQTYDESNNFGAIVAVFNGRDGLWDLSLAADPGATPGSTYCLIATKSDNSTLSSYTVIPEISIPNSTLEQSNYRFYQNANSVAPGGPLAAQNTKSTIPVGSAFRLRQLLRQTSEVSEVGTSFKLQAAEKITTCSAGGYATLSTVASSGTPTSTGFKNPILAEDAGDTSSGSWANTLEATIEDGMGSYYTITNSGVTNTSPLVTRDYGFAIPAQAEITGVELRYKTVVAYNVGESGIHLTKDGSSAAGANKASGASISEGIAITKGGSSDLWGASLTPNEVNSTSFGARFVASLDFSNSVPDIEIDYMSMNIHYITGATVASFVNNANPTDEAVIGLLGDDPTATSGTVIPQSYTEDETFSAQTAIQNGENGMWDFALRADESLEGKTYCFRVAKNDGSPLATYAQYPEVTFTAAAPTLDQQLRGGQSVIRGSKRPFNW